MPRPERGERQNGRVDARRELSEKEKREADKKRLKLHKEGVQHDPTPPDKESVRKS